VTDHDEVLDRIRALGYAVSEHRLGHLVEMHAVLLVEPHTQFIATCRDGDGPAKAATIARLLEQMVRAGLHTRWPDGRPD
jgi:DNA-binding IclR family transcriptional regulator